jgi:hypothetical protein
MVEEGLTHFIMNHAAHPPAGVLTEDGPVIQQIPLFMRLREAHAVVGDPQPAPLTADGATMPTGGQGAPAGVNNAGGGPTFDDGMSNAWFAGNTGSVQVFDVGQDGCGISVGGGAAARASERGKNVFVQAAGGRGGRGVYRCWPRGGYEGEGWEGYVHDGATCEGCLAREAVAERARIQEAREREKLFGSVGLGMDETPQDKKSEEDEAGDADWDPVEETEEQITFGPEGQEIVHPAQSRAHGRRKVLPCNGIKEILLFGEVSILF